MAISRKPGPFGRDPFHLCPVTPGPRGLNDAASPDAPADLLGDTPGSLGCSDYAAPEAKNSPFGLGTLHFTASWDKDLLLWDYDPDRLLKNSSNNPKFVEAAHKALADAVNLGLRPKVHWAYRSPEESDDLVKKGKAANSAWGSCHNYGLAMDVYFYDRNGKVLKAGTALPKVWYPQYKRFAKIAMGFVWGEAFRGGDADHFEFHPNWAGGAASAFLHRVKAWAQRAAHPETSVAEWMPFVWWAAGAGGTSPPTAFLTKNPPPKKAEPKTSK